MRVRHINHVLATEERHQITLLYTGAGEVFFRFLRISKICTKKRPPLCASKTIITSKILIAYRLMAVFVL